MFGAFGVVNINTLTQLRRQFNVFLSLGWRIFASIETRKSGNSYGQREMDKYPMFAQGICEVQV